MLIKSNNTHEEYRRGLAEFACGLITEDFQPELDEVAAQFGVASGCAYNLNGSYQKPSEFDDLAYKGRAGYYGEWQETSDGVRFPAVTFHTHRHGGHTIAYCGLKRVHELYRLRHDSVLATRQQQAPRLAIQKSYQPNPADVERTRNKFRGWLKQSYSLDSPEAEIGRAYLHSRGFNALGDSLPNWRFHPAMEYWCTDQNDKPQKLGTFPALLGSIVDIKGAGVGVHTTYLQPDGAGKIQLTEPGTGESLPAKKTRSLYPGATKGAAIQLYPADSRLAVTEGIETGLAIRQTTGLPVWATVSAGGMAKLELPEHINEIIIAADNDGSKTGERVARELAKRLLKTSRIVKIIMPNKVGTDWADVLEGERHA